jgi:two-component system cell cycle response regulator
MLSERPSARVSNPEAAERMTVLIADDDVLAAKVLEKTLKKWGYDVVRAKNGEEAWEQLEKKSLRLAILDWMMPKLDGVQLCRKVRRKKGATYTYIILLTARDYFEDIIRGLSAGADDYMTKPVNLLELKARLQTGLRILELEDKLLESRQELKEMAAHDSLTGLWNRSSILEFLEDELEKSRRERSSIGVIMIDVDHFKRINDTFGHAVGDQVLNRIADCLKTNIRRYNKIGRYGGDEMVVVLPDCQKDHLEKIAERLRASVARHRFKTEPGALKVTISCGGASSESFQHATLRQLLQASDRALYEAKAKGRNLVVLFKPGRAKRRKKRA